MASFDIVTVATHDEGTYNTLIQNPYYSDIVVLGFGKQWEGFMMKYRLVYEYIQDKSDDSIIIFLDGFDSLIHGNPQEAVDYFKEQDKKILYSVDKVDHPLQSFIYHRVFPNKHNINSGMYIGYVKYIKLFLKKVLQSKFTSDQKATIESFHHFNFIGTDDTQMIFKNKLMQTTIQVTDDDPIFVSFPGFLHPNRVYRSFFEYSQFFMDMYMVLFSFILLICYRFNVYSPIIIITLFYGILFYYMDKSSFVFKESG